MAAFMRSPHIFVELKVLYVKVGDSSDFINVEVVRGGEIPKSNYYIYNHLHPT